MRIRIALVLTFVLLALCIGTGPARAALPFRGLDPSFGNAGIATAVLPKTEGYKEIQDFEVTADGRAYVLDGSTLLALQSDGQPASEFGEAGEVSVAPTTGVADSASLAFDSQGRLLVAGSAHAEGRSPREAYVIRILPSGARDPTFGGGDGEVETNFDLPPRTGAKGPGLQIGSLFVDAEDRPILGGAFGTHAVIFASPRNPCEYATFTDPKPFLGRLTASGEIDKSFSRNGFDVLRGVGHVTSIAPTPAGSLAVFRRPCTGPPKPELQPQLFSLFTESGKIGPPVRKDPLAFSYVLPMVDPRGRVLELESPPPAAEEGHDALVRYLPSGRIDSSFGRHGRVVLRRGLPSSWTFAVDSRSRPIVAAVETRNIEMARFLPSGKLDAGFGPGGRLRAKGLEPSAIALDSLGRIYSVSRDRRSEEDTVIRVARFIPGS